MIELKNITQHFERERGVVHALRDVSVHITRGEIFGIIGQSGAGKSTLLRTMNLLTRPVSGRVIVAGCDLMQLDAQSLRRARRDMGMVFQHFNLLGSRTVSENIALPLELADVRFSERRAIVMSLLERVGLQKHGNAYPAQLSGGQKQRVGIARALAAQPQPRILLLDEATSALDPQTTRDILKLLKRLRCELQLTIVAITHQIEVVKGLCDRIAVLEAGCIVETGPVRDVFLCPRHPVTRALLGDLVSHELPPMLKSRVIEHMRKGVDHLLRLAFTQGSVEQPLLSEAIRQYELDFNILHGQIDEVQGQPFGVLVVLVGGEKSKISAAISFLTRHGVVVETLTATAC